MLEIEEKEGNHIAYLEVELEGLSLAEEDNKAVDDHEDEGAKVWKGLR